MESCRAATAPAPITSSAFDSIRRFFRLELLDNRYPVLHGLRVLAILSVVQLHVTVDLFENKVPLKAGLRSASQSFWFGMDFFFIVSGFLIGGILLRALDAADSMSLRRFWLRRAFRTFPPYYVVLIFLALAFPLSASQRANLPYELVYLTNFRNPLRGASVVMIWGWSLALEEQFYLFAPGLLYILTKLRSDRSRLAFLGVLWVVPLLLRLYLCLSRGWTTRTDVWFGAYAQLSTFTRSDTLVAGVMLAYVQRRWGDRLAEWFSRLRVRVAAELCAGTCLLLLMPGVTPFRNDALQWVFAFGTISSIMHVSMLLVVLNGPAGAVMRLLSAPVFRRIATLGYGVYLVHFPIITPVLVPIGRQLSARGWNAGLIWIGALSMCVGASVAVSYVMHALIEKPSLRLRDRLTTERAKGRGAPAEAQQQLGSCERSAGVLRDPKRAPEAAHG